MSRLFDLLATSVITASTAIASAAEVGIACTAESVGVGCEAASIGCEASGVAVGGLPVGG